MYECKVLADSEYYSKHEQYRLTTFQVTFPRFILAEVNTHRMLSRNSASSRAIPVAKSIDAVSLDPFRPEIFGRNQKGMSWRDVLSDDDDRAADAVWETQIDSAIYAARALDKLDVHKALANRVLEPFKWHTAIITATDWSNFFALRTDANAQPEFRKIALMMREAFDASTPRVSVNAWHLPLVDRAEILTHDPEPGSTDWELWKKVAIGRCARVSYLTHDGKRDLEADVALHDRLRVSGHLSPFEHVARPFTPTHWQMIAAGQSAIRDWVAIGSAERLCRKLEYEGNLHGWYSARMEVPFEWDFSQHNAVH